MLCQKNDADNFISGYKLLVPAIKYHTQYRKEDVAREIYEYLEQGKIVIIDLSVGNAVLRDKISKKIAAYVFNKSMDKFTNGEKPNNIVVYIEEAHNLIGKNMDLTDTWPRLAKEGAKYNLALVYATQEVSSISSNILKNTQNWFIAHLNNEDELKEIKKFYDFADFCDSLIRYSSGSDKGFIRMKTYSNAFVVPVQIDRFTVLGDR